MRFRPSQFDLELLHWAAQHAPDLAVHIINREYDAAWVARCLAAAQRLRDRAAGPQIDPYEAAMLERADLACNWGFAPKRASHEDCGEAEQDQKPRKQDVKVEQLRLDQVTPELKSAAPEPKSAAPAPNPRLPASLPPRRAFRGRNKLPLAGGLFG